MLGLSDMEEVKNTKNADKIIEEMFKVGAHFGYSKSRRHPTASPYIFGVKNRVEIFDLAKTADLLKNALDFVAGLAKEGRQILFVGGKNEARDLIKKAANSIDMPYVAGRWIGGTFTNFPEIKKRIAKLEDLTKQKEKGELAKYTKKERLVIDRNIANLERFFSGLLLMKEMPKAIFVIDPKNEMIAVKEANKMGIPVIALAGSDCDIKDVDYPIAANDSSVSSISFFADEIVGAYRKNKMSTPNKV
ncbi:MAG: 30S ribosomal protein S2 [Patescibacteria group bacterium]|mgnify:CR=1 FL=1